MCRRGRRERSAPRWPRAGRGPHGSSEIVIFPSPPPPRESFQNESPCQLYRRKTPCMFCIARGAAWAVFIIRVHLRKKQLSYFRRLGTSKQHRGTSAHHGSPKVARRSARNDTRERIPNWPLPHETLPRSGRVTRWTNTPVRIFKDPAPPPSRPRYIYRPLADSSRDRPPMPPKGKKRASYRGTLCVAGEGVPYDAPPPCKCSLARVAQSL